MPVSLTAVVRGIVVLLMAAHVCCEYGLALAIGGPAGSGHERVLMCSLFALAMLVPLAVGMAGCDLPEIFRRSVGHRRWAAGRCSECGYPVEASASDACPECGSAVREPAPYRFGWGTVRRFVILALVAWLVGCLAGETWLAA